jgi:hypothetical protein
MLDFGNGEAIAPCCCAMSLVSEVWTSTLLHNSSLHRVDLHCIVQNLLDGFARVLKPAAALF